MSITKYDVAEKIVWLQDRLEVAKDLILNDRNQEACVFFDRLAAEMKNLAVRVKHDLPVRR